MPMMVAQMHCLFRWAICDVLQMFCKGIVVGSDKPLLAALRAWFARCGWPRRPSASASASVAAAAAAAAAASAHESAHRQALDLLRAVDAGGVPLHPARVNQIGRALGLDVSSAAPVGDTVARIRAAVTRLG